MGLIRMLRAPAMLICVVTVPTLSGATAANAQEKQSRLVKEARKLFKVVDRGASARCKFDSSWDKRPVLAETAQRYLKLLVRADLVVSEPTATPMQIIDPAGRETGAFCTSDERNAAWQAMIAALQPGEDRMLRLTSISYGFPVFNVDFTRAAIIVHSFGEAWRKTADGTPRRSIEAGGGAQIYAKRRGVWRQVDYDSYFTAH